ncbi:MAG: ATP-binding protein [Candidatus Gribaldobacteria bacterium]|nr:ATP-binding protein [Candidatus Gribaldobacteria bacterium]
MVDKKETKIKSEKAKTSDYSAKDIYVMKGLEAVRKRPGMYIGSTGPDGLHHLIWEIVDNGLDEAMGGYCHKIELTIMEGNKVMVTDDGRGIPVETHPQTGLSTLETVMTILHAGGKFGGAAYKVSGGLLGVGVSVVCALTKHMKAEVCRDGSKYAQEYAKGLVVTKVKKIGTCDQTGTTISFEPDQEIFKDTNFNLKRILSHLRQQSYLTPGVQIIIKDERVKPNFAYTFYFEGGLKAYVRHLIGDNETHHENAFYVKGEREDVLVNNIYNPEGGTHLTGFRTALTRCLNDYARKNGYLKEKDENLMGNDVREGLVAAVSVKIKDPQFEGQTKAKLGNVEAKTAVESITAEALADFLEKNPSEARSILDNCLLAARARRAAKAARATVLRKGVLDGMTLPGKLADCSNKAASDSEIYIVEGDSAGGCFFGETKVALVDGRDLSFFELIKEEQIGKRNYCYTIKKDGFIGVGEIKNVRRTKQQVEVIKIVLDNNEEIICTPDHKFMMRNGEYKQAKEISKKDSLMPLHQRIAKKGGLITIDGYEMTFCPKTHKWIFTHLLADRYNLDKKVYQKQSNSVIHHKDYNKLNNNPDNLCRMEKMEHLIFHATLGRENLSKPEILAKIRQTHQSKEYREKISRIMLEPAMRKMLSERAKKQWESEEYKSFMVEKFLSFYNSNDEYRKKNNENLNNQQKRYWGNLENRKIQSEKVREYFKNNPDRKEEFSKMAKDQWDNFELLQWRSQKTKEQWITEFRAKRKMAYDKTYLDNSLKLLKEILEKTGEIDLAKYKELRIERSNKNALKYSTVLERFFNSDEIGLCEAVKNYNHKIKRIEMVNKKVDVYDLEVEGTNNFALAGGVFVHNSAKMARDRRFQAILPLRGKILNVEKARLDKMLASQEVKNLIIALGTAIAQDFDVAKLRYHKIILMTDADVDGSHIRTLLLTLFYRHFKEIVEKGYLYIAQPPLYKIQAGKQMYYAYTDEDKEVILSEFRKNKAEKAAIKEEKNKSAKQAEAVDTSEAEGEVSTEGGEEVVVVDKISGVSIQRYKGLGEMNPEQLWETTMNPENRILLQVSIDDAKEADHIFDVLMGSEVAPRKKFIQVHAKQVKNLDI